MCGIFGAWTPRGDSGSLARTMAGHLIHRGPDDEGFWSYKDLTLGHRRLAIMDLSSDGRQPMSAYDDELSLVANGEIYNYRALRAELEAEGCIFRTHCDSEVILHAYRMCGVKAFERFNGMFAFALFDKARETLHLVRDRAGIKPLYYWRTDEGVLFASEIKAIIAASGKSRWSIDLEGLGAYLRFENLVGDRTLFDGVKALQPGMRLEMSCEGFRIERYADLLPPTPDPSLSFTEAVDAFRETMADAVSAHLMSDVPVATYLSAGFDSTLVASGAAKMLASPPKAFTGYFREGGWYDETSGARLVGKHIGVDVDAVPIDAEAVSAAFDDFVFALDEPRMGSGGISQYLVAGAAARHGKVILTGHGGDELFSGYPVFKFAEYFGVGGLSALANIARVKTSEIPHIVYFAARRMLSQGHGQSRGQSHGAGQSLPVLFNDQRLDEALMPLVRDGMKSPEESLRRILGDPQTPYEDILTTYLRVYLPGLLTVEDKISMAHSLEARTPFLDNRMLALSRRIPSDVKLSGGALKAVIKAAARDALPEALFTMPKRGFPTPLAHWLRGPLAEWAEQRLTAEGSALTRLMRTEFLKQEFSGFQRSWARHARPFDEIQTHRMWMLLNLESWIRGYEERLGVVLEP